MIGTAIGATLGSHTALKLAIGTLTAALTVGGTVAVTGNLPDSAQCIVADAAAHVGLTLPRPQLEAHGDTGLFIDDVVELGGMADLAITAPGLPQVAVDNAAGLKVCGEGRGSDGTDGSGGAGEDASAPPSEGEGDGPIDGTEPEDGGADGTNSSDGSVELTDVDGSSGGDVTVDFDADGLADAGLRATVDHDTAGDTGSTLSLEIRTDETANLEDQAAALRAACLALRLG